MIEEFFKAHQHTLAAIAAFGTLAAVVTSLVLAWSARRADRTQLSAFANLITIFHPTIDPETAPEYLRVRITNQGKWPLRIPASFFYWKVPFKREYMMVRPRDLTASRVIAAKGYPIEVAPRTSESFFISELATFKQEVKRMLGANTFVDRVRFRFIKGFVQTDDGETFRVKLSPEVRQVWAGRAGDVNG
jgi:hypothetical protein